MSRWRLRWIRRHIDGDVAREQARKTAEEAEVQRSRAEAQRHQDDARRLVRRIDRAEASAHELARHNGFAKAAEAAFHRRRS